MFFLLCFDMNITGCSSKIFDWNNDYDIDYSQNTEHTESQHTQTKFRNDVERRIVFTLEFEEI